MTSTISSLLTQFQKDQCELIDQRDSIGLKLLRNAEEQQNAEEQAEISRLIGLIKKQQESARKYSDIIVHMVDKGQQISPLGPVPKRLLVAQARKLENDQMKKNHQSLQEEIDRLSSIISNYQGLLKSRESENREVKRQLGEHFRSNEQLVEELCIREDSAQRMQTGCDTIDDIQKGIQEISAEISMGRGDTEEQLDKLKEAAIEINYQKNGRGILAMKMYRAVLSERAKIWNEIQDLKGSIRVFCRIKPSSETSIAPSNFENKVTVLQKGKKRRFEFDRVFSPASTQAEVFEDTKPLIRSVIDGYNVCIFAYGQTGSGKTHTMQGPSKDPGVNTRALKELFTVTQDRSDLEGFRFDIQVSVFEIYNDSVYDLLQSKRVALDVRQGADGMDVIGGSSQPVTKIEDVERIIRVGQKNRSTASTNLNEHSSRSHLLLRVKILGLNELTGESTQGKLTLVDLAGSERLSRSGATGQAAKETAHINQSLSSLGNVISALQQGNDQHVPYRNSKLTYLLQDSLGTGGSKTLMFIQVDSQDVNVSESIQSLNFGMRVRNVDLGQAKKNQNVISDLPLSSSSSSSS
jgi:kinesin family protein C2/C3